VDNFATTMIRAFSKKVKKRILLAEDDPVMRRLMELQLDDAGYDVVSVEDGRQALLYLQQEDFDLVISDIIMPFVSGLELLESVRKSEKDTAIVLCSALKSHNAMAKAFEIGANGFIAKPFESNHLINEIREIILEQERLRGIKSAD
jgi:two-component system response regulator VicR